MRCIDVTHMNIYGEMAIPGSTLKAPLFRRSAVQEARRLLALPGIIAIVGALLAAGVSFAILVGVTPITPNRTITLTLIGLNAFFIIVLTVLIGREVHRILLARRVGKAASRLHVRIVMMFAIVAAVPAIVVAVIAMTQRQRPSPLPPDDAAHAGTGRERSAEDAA